MMDDGNMKDICLAECHEVAAHLEKMRTYQPNLGGDSRDSNYEVMESNRPSGDGTGVGEVRMVELHPDSGMGQNETLDADSYSSDGEHGALIDDVGTWGRDNDSTTSYDDVDDPTHYWALEQSFAVDSHCLPRPYSPSGYDSDESQLSEWTDGECDSSLNSASVGVYK
jgi:hypothetical protein